MDLEAEADLEVEADLVVVVVEDLLEELALPVQLQDLEGDLIHMGIVDRIVDTTDHGGIIIDLGTTDGGILHGGRDDGIVLGIIAQCMLVEVLHPLSFLR